MGRNLVCILVLKIEITAGFTLELKNDSCTCYWTVHYPLHEHHHYHPHEEEYEKDELGEEFEDYFRVVAEVAENKMFK